jgi:hypothetical protein
LDSSLLDGAERCGCALTAPCKAMQPKTNQIPLVFFTDCQEKRVIDRFICKNSGLRLYIFKRNGNLFTIEFGSLAKRRDMFSIYDPYQSHPTQRVKTTLSVSPELFPLVRRRAIEVIRGIDMRGDWLFGVELKQVADLTLVKVRTLSPDQTTIAVASISLSEFPKLLDVRHRVQPFGDTQVASVVISFPSGEHLELDTAANQLMELRTYAPDGVDMLAPWVTLALTA